MNSGANIEQFICTVSLLLCIAAVSVVVDGFSTISLQRIPPSPINNIHQPSTYYHHNNNNILLYQSKIIDVEVIPNEEPDSSSTTTNPSTSSNEEEDELNLIQYSQNQDPEWKDMPISYCDIVSNTYIDCNLVFYVKDPSFKSDGSSGGKGRGREKGTGREAGASDYEGAEYALGVPTEIPIVVALELDDSEGKSSNKGTNTVNLNKVLPINPDLEEEVEGSMTEEEKEEIFQLAARALQTEYGKSIRMKKTPRVLTLEGELDEIIGNWKDVLLGNTKEKKQEISIDDALNVLDEDDDEEEDYFDKIMRRDLGDDYMSLLDDDDDDPELDAELLKLFDNSAISDEEESLDTLLNEIDTQESQYKETTYNDLIQQLQPSAALKLLNFIGPNNKEYTILKPLRPILLIGKEDPSDYTRRILLTEEERAVILPRLEKSCRDGLEEAGYFLDGGSGGSKLGV